MAEKESNLTEISKVIFVSRKHSIKIRGLHPYLGFGSKFLWNVFITKKKIP